MVLRLSRVRPGVTIALGLFVPVTENLSLTTGLRHKKSFGFKRLFGGKPEAVRQQKKEGKDLRGWLGKAL